MREYLPPQVGASRIVSQTKMFIDASTSFPIRATWTEDSNVRIVVQNLATKIDGAANAVDLNLGYGTYGTDNHTTEPIVVPAGSEWVGNASPLPVYCRFTTGTGYINIITERVA